MANDDDADDIAASFMICAAAYLQRSKLSTTWTAHSSNFDIRHAFLMSALSRNSTPNVKRGLV
jgi:hypothetical protein